MLVGFTVSKHGDKSMISAISYTCIWDGWARAGIKIVYKYKHLADEEHPHIHYHGLLECPLSFRYKDYLAPGYTIRYETKFKNGYEKWHNYCMHEMRENIKKLNEDIEISKGQKLLDNVMECGKTYQTHIKVKKTGSNTGKIILYI